MPDLSLTPEQELLRSAAREFVDRECPLAAVRRIEEQQGGFSRELWEKMAALGWTGILVPPEHGGEGGSLTDAAVLLEELGRGIVPGPFHSSAILGALLLQHAGSEEQQARLLPAVARGERILALAFTEADYGWGPEQVRMPVSRASGAFVLNGAKHFVADAAAADTLVCVARTAAHEDAQHGLTLFLVDAKRAGVTITPVEGFLGEPFGHVAFADVEVPAADVVGDVDGAWRALAPVLDTATALLCAYIAGASRRVYEMSLGYAQRREQFGQSIARFQRVQDHLIEMLNHADAARWTAYEAVWKLEHGQPDAQEAVSVAKAVASEGFYQLCDAAHHVHGGIGAEKGYGLYLYTERSRSLYHELGDPAFHRARIARLLAL